MGRMPVPRVDFFKLLVVFVFSLALALRADPGRIYSVPDPAAQGGIEGGTAVPLTHALAVAHDRLRVYRADLTDGGKTFQFHHLPVGKYDLVLVTTGNEVFEGLALGDPPENLDPVFEQSLRTRVGAADSFFNRFAILRTGVIRTGVSEDEVLALVERIRDRPTLQQSGEKLNANLRRLEIMVLMRADGNWKMSTAQCFNTVSARHIFREEEPVRPNPPFMKHFFVSAIGNLRVVDTVKQLGGLSLPSH